MSPYETEGALSWIEFAVNDLKKAIEFYKSAYGWIASLETLPDGGAYYTLKLPDAEIPFGGTYQLSDEVKAKGIKPHIENYITTLDYEAKSKVLLDLGATCIWGPIDLPKIGRLGGFQTPIGTHNAIIEYLTGE